MVEAVQEEQAISLVVEITKSLREGAISLSMAMDSVASRRK